MVTKTKEVAVIHKPTEKERLELLEKKVEIQKKRLEIKKEKMTIDNIDTEKEKIILDLFEQKVSIKTKQLENRKAKLDMEEILVSRKHESDKLLNDKIFAILVTLASTTIDEDRTILGSEPFFKPLLPEQNRIIVTKKLIELITKL